MPCPEFEAVYEERYQERYGFWRPKIIAFIACLPKPWRRQERHQTEVIEKILRHCGLWDQPSTRAPPSAKGSVTG